MNIHIYEVFRIVAASIKYLTNIQVLFFQGHKPFLFQLSLKTELHWEGKAKG